ncbi:MAG TPA: hypothetical protein VIM25_01570 [Candidatus Limnocylindrales bacterium]
MDDRGQPVTRLGPDSDGRGSAGPGGPGGPGGPRIYRWEWGPDDARRPGLPWIGIFLLVFGVLLLIQQAFPQLKAAGSLVVLAIGLAFLVRWAIERGTGSLYAGAIITALAVPGLLNAAGVQAEGLGTFSFGVAFLFIAAVRAASGGGVGWQLWFGGFLALLGGVSMAGASFGPYVVPIILVALGAMLILRGWGARAR